DVVVEALAGLVQDTGLERDGAGDEDRRIVERDVQAVVGLECQVVVAASVPQGARQVCRDERALAAKLEPRRIRFGAESSGTLEDVRQPLLPLLENVR